ncbi:hypothetical protein Nepgr_020668 [Nepenthes gracilis]|uniref:Transcription repressor n=1 Tax=Nepenthes gracilis TaxID=150966 RepID=A0AAD3SYE9_NEPGR|nr:hypothetical protein Nepgr_020668 [Nepenthes gracilis]
MFAKHIHLCFSKIRCLPTSFSQPSTLDEEEDGADDKHPSQISSSTTELTTTKSFNSAHGLSSSDYMSKSDDFSSNSDSHSETPCQTEFSAISASPRFIVDSPGRSKSILDSTDSVTRVVIGGCAVAVRKYSPDPYTEFRRSMQDMIDAREDKRDWKYLHELLFCYLKLNPRPNHRYIIGAFADLLVSHSSSSDRGGRSLQLRLPSGAVSRRQL